MKKLVLVLFAAFAALGQQVPGRYVVELDGDPAAVAAVKQGSRFAARAAGFGAVRASVRQAQSNARQEVATHGGAVIESMDTVLNALVVTIPEARAAELAQVPGVIRVHPVDRIQPLLNHALGVHHVPEAWAALPTGQGGAGAGIKIAMIDSGIDVNHPAFSAALPAVSGFPKVLSSADTAFTNAKIIVAKNYTRLLPDGGEPDADDRDGHGTGTAIAAAGGPVVSPYGPLSGVAPAAYLGNYKVLDGNGSTSDVVAKAIDDAVADGMDVINLSLGSYVTSYRQVAASSLSVSTLEGATRAGVIVVVAAGNSGPGSTTIGDYGSAPDAITLGAIMNDRSLGNAVSINGGSSYAAVPGDGPDPGSAVGATLFDVATIDPSGLGCSPLPDGSVAGLIVLVARGTCSFASKLNNVAAGGAAAALIYNNGGTPFAYRGQTVGTATLPALFLAQSSGLDLKSRIAADPNLQVTLDFSGTTAFPARTDVTDFSSRGPSLGAALKPDLVAVGDEIVTGAEKTFSSGESYSASGYIDTGGTSFSSPLAAGAAAVLKGARPGLTLQQYRSLLINSATGATKDVDTAAGVQQAGAGVLNLAAALSGTIAAYPTSLNFGAGSGTGTLRSTLSLSVSNTGTAGDTYTIAVVPSAPGPAPVLSNDTIHVDANGIQQVMVTLNATDLLAGEYQGYLRISGTAGSSVASVPYWFAAPGNSPAGISVLYQKYSAAAGSDLRQAIVFRVTDVSGLPYSGPVQPTVDIVSSGGGGTIRNFYIAGDVPGTYALDLRTGTGSIQVGITAGTLTRMVTIGVN